MSNLPSPGLVFRRAMALGVNLSARRRPESSGRLELRPKRWGPLDFGSCELKALKAVTAGDISAFHAAVACLQNALMHTSLRQYGAFHCSLPRSYMSAFHAAVSAWWRCFLLPRLLVIYVPRCW